MHHFRPVFQLLEQLGLYKPRVVSFTVSISPAGVHGGYKARDTMRPSGEDSVRSPEATSSARFRSSMSYRRSVPLDNLSGFVAKGLTRGKGTSDISVETAQTRFQLAGSPEG